MAEERSFESLAEAARFMEEEIDRPTPDRATDLGNGLELRAFPHEFPDGGFTNV